jgi:hypothetical protein
MFFYLIRINKKLNYMDWKNNFLYFDGFKIILVKNKLNKYYFFQKKNKMTGVSLLISLILGI